MTESFPFLMVVNTSERKNSLANNKIKATVIKRFLFFNLAGCHRALFQSCVADMAQYLPGVLLSGSAVAEKSRCQVEAEPKARRRAGA